MTTIIPLGTLYLARMTEPAISIISRGLIYYVLIVASFFMNNHDGVWCDARKVDDTGQEHDGSAQRQV